MDKLKMHTPNKADENFKKLAELFPNAVTETIDENGEVVRAIDKDVLMQEISCTVVDGNEERYQFTWPDKKKSVLLANAPINKTLRPCREESVDFDTTENLYIEGDNLEVLKLLQETYLGKIKMIYIDPPYNTGNDFVYEDDFAQNTDEYLTNSGQFDEDGNRLVKNLDSNGRFHTDWLNMIYPRLKLAKDLLSDDGIMLISIDDNEIDNLTRCCSEIFGESNLIATFVVASNSAKNNSKFVSITHEYLLCVAKNKEETPAGWAVAKTNSDSFIKVSQQLLKSGKSMDEIHSELLALVKYPKYYEFDHYTYVDERGPFRASDLTAPGSKAKYNVIHPITKKPCKTGSRGWAYSESEMQKLIDNDYILFGSTETVMPQLKNYLFDNEKSLPKSVLFFDSQSSTKWMKAQGFGFDFPKAIDYIKFVVSMYPQTEYEILDFFSGSATTAHAIMQLNAEDGGHRKFIMVQLPEKCDEKSEAYKAGYKNICEIGKERIRRAGKKIKDENPLNTQNLDIGFRVLKCDTSNMKDVYYSPADFELNLLDMMEDNIKEDRTPEDLLFQVMLDLGVTLSSKIEETTIAGKKVFDVADGFLIACFDKDVNDETIKAIAQKQPYYFVMRDSSLANDSVATNFEQIFATYSPDTVRKVL
ncbi:MAG: site-specific DNA-methyltransferase [Clostridium sp.]